MITTVQLPHSSHRLSVQLPHSSHRLSVQLPHSSHRLSVQLPHSSHRLSVQLPHSSHRLSVQLPHSSHTLHISIFPCYKSLCLINTESVTSLYSFSTCSSLFFHILTGNLLANYPMRKQYKSLTLCIPIVTYQPVTKYPIKSSFCLYCRSCVFN